MAPPSPQRHRDDDTEVVFTHADRMIIIIPCIRPAVGPHDTRRMMVGCIHSPLPDYGKP
ncbi:hypothetical protein BDQ94DRAFT_164554 [Aspergillus welwitschiae]|uniref:Uncharacterized protein n=1 Tax=Aspergillus welwitschiae TaxID=1341132 RepID=A0A3F3PI29_9EURO|nr:hypothetical protein BDQ94DRAFT_164554 [Aspergillus welwitschiae]RDH26352.1 hypothetical protein BDQ94DRAFT_164554 [Aspergillus welwitschiae]